MIGPDQPGPVPSRADLQVPVEVDQSISLYDYIDGIYLPANRLNVPLQQEHRDICDTLEAAYLGEMEQQFLWITMPPRTGKTTLANGCGSWGFGYFPASQQIYTGYNDNIATVSLDRVTQTLQTPEYQEFFGDIIHSSPSGYLSTTSGGQAHAEGVGGALLGKGAGLKEPAGGCIFVDDPAKPQDVLSPRMAEKLKQWVENPLLHRRNSDRWCPIIGIAQRLGLTDLVEYFKRQYPKETLILKFPGFNPSGRSLFPSTISDSRWEQMGRTRYGRWMRAAIYQQDPTVLGGNLIPTDKFLRHSDHNLLWDEKIIVCDTALKKGEENDYWVLQCWGRANGKCYLLDSSRQQCNSAEFCKSAVLFYRKHNDSQQYIPVSRFIIEDSAAGPGIISFLNEGGIPAVPIIPIKDKASRVNDIIPFIETGMVYIPADDDPEAAVWLQDFLTECSAFSQDLSHEHDDQTDCLAYAINQLIGQGISILQALGAND